MCRSLSPFGQCCSPELEKENRSSSPSYRRVKKYKLVRRSQLPIEEGHATHKLRHPSQANSAYSKVGSLNITGWKKYGKDQFLPGEQTEDNFLTGSDGSSSPYQHNMVAGNPWEYTLSGHPEPSGADLVRAFFRQDDEKKNRQVAEQIGGFGETTGNESGKTTGKERRESEDWSDTGDWDG